MKLKKLLPSQILNEAAKLVSKGWIRHLSSADIHNRWVPVRDKTACKYCITGAILRASEAFNEVRCAQEFGARRYALAVVGEETLVGWNDHTAANKKEVVMVLKLAADMAKSVGE